MVLPIHDDNPTQRRPAVTLLLIAACILVFVLVQPRGDVSEENAFAYEHAAIPCELNQGHPLTEAEYTTGECVDSATLPDAPSLVPGFERGNEEFFPDKNVWLAVLTSMFLHASWWHLLGNMLFLWVFGNNVEDRLGWPGFLAFYLVAGAAAMAAHVLADPGSTLPVVGASGAIAGVMGMYLVLWPRARILSIVPLFLFIAVYIPAGLVLALWFGLQFLTNPDSGVAWVAHVGGFLFGMGVGGVLRAVAGPGRQRPAVLEEP